MGKTLSQTETSLQVAAAEVADTGRIRVGAGFRLPPAKVAAEVADTGRVSFGAGFRLPSARAR